MARKPGSSGKRQRPTAKSAEPADTTGGALRVAAYCRYSEGPGQDDGSIEAQHAAILRESARVGNWRITWYDEPKQTSYNVEEIADRPIFSRLLGDVQAGQYDLVVCHKLDRWSRKLRISLQALELVLGSRTNYRALADGVDLDSISGWFQYSLMALLAEHYSRNLSHETLKGKAIRAQNGLHGAIPPYGYVLGPDGVAIPNTGEDRAWEGLQALIGHILAGKSGEEVARELNRAGYAIRRYPKRPAGPFVVRVIAAIRGNVFYRPYKPGDDRGTIVWQGEEYRGQHQAACSWDEWHAMQEIAAGHRRGWQTPREESYTAEFRGIVACAACGNRLYVHRSRNTAYAYEAARYERYKCLSQRPQMCVCYKRWTSATDVRAVWLDWVAAHLSLPADWEQIVREGVLRGGAEPQSTPDELAAARERKRWEQKRARAKRMYMDLEIDDQEWERRRREADDALASLAAAARRPEQQVTRLVDAGRMLENIASYWRVWTTQEQQQAAALLIEPRGLLVRPLGYRGWLNYHQVPHVEPPLSCELVEVRLREPFRDLLHTLHNVQDHAG